MAMIPPNVQRGAELFDERLPGWAEAIDQNALDMSVCNDCVAGQIFGDYDRGLAILGIDKPTRFGFHLLGRQTFDRLTSAWLDAIRERTA